MFGDLHLIKEVNEAEEGEKSPGGGMCREPLSSKREGVGAASLPQQIIISAGGVDNFQLASEK